MTREQLTQVWLDWLNLKKDPTINAVIRNEENGPRPDRPYLSLKIISGPVPLGSEDIVPKVVEEPADVPLFHLGGPARYTMSVQGYGVGALEELARLHMLLDNPLEISWLRAQGDIAVESRGQVADLSVLLDTGFESRGGFDIQFTATRTVEVDLGVIETVQLSGTLTSDSGSEFQVPLTVTEGG